MKQERSRARRLAPVGDGRVPPLERSESRGGPGALGAEMVRFSRAAPPGAPEGGISTWNSLRSVRSSRAREIGPAHARFRGSRPGAC